MKSIEYEEVGDVELDEEISARLEASIAQAESEFHETRVNFRWGTEQLAVVKRAAATMGVPYKTYLKQVVYQQALRDLEADARLHYVGPA